MTDLTDAELAEIARANESGRKPIVFIHGLWLLSSSWDKWRALFEDNGYITLAPGWPDDPETVALAKENPEVFAKKMIKGVTEHYLDAISRLDEEPAVIGHSFGGMLAQRIAGKGGSSATVAIDPAPFRGILPLPLSSLKSASPVLGNPANAGRAVALTFEQFSYGWSNAIPEEEGRALYEEFHVPASGSPLFEAATANFNPFTNAKVDTKNPDRGPLMIIAGEKDNTVPLAITEAMYKAQSKNPGLTEIVKVPDRGHSLTIDHGWKEVAEIAVEFIRRVGDDN
jgi:non-heme chloroperoxidase